MPVPDPYEPGGAGFMAARAGEASAQRRRDIRNLLLLLSDSALSIPCSARAGDQEDSDRDD